ncbi:pilus assembly protein TadG-related protein [Actinacidiphila yeochonensis]|uniref:pilus assembly protein TadG-related protein n=1 Tax=Actinacidiphila yeochonensis TaxID=89050 RepID=UPI00069016C7|nr:pilus assembly protein TadG-related protein [Actinacidiphila yeochonensis]
MNPPASAHTGFTAGIRARCGDGGQATAFFVGVFLALWLFAGIVLDGGLTLAGKTRAMDVAQEAARTGAEQVDLARLRRGGDVRLLKQQAAEAARRYVASTGDSGTASVAGDAVTVQVTHRQRMQILQLVGVRALTVHATATAHAERAPASLASSPGGGGER